MIDGTYTDRMNRLWEWLARGLVRAGWSPNAVTVAGAGLVLVSCAAYLWHRNGWVFAISLAIAFSFDGLDGAVARLTGRTSHLGGYLDAIIDRYQEAAVLAAIALLHDQWAAAFFAITGSLLISYNKARVAMEMPTGNTEWPDLMERMERLIFIVAMILAAEVAALAGWTRGGVFQSGLWILAALTHFSALQRFRRACARIGEFDRRKAGIPTTTKNHDYTD